MTGRISKRHDSATISDDRVSSIQLELERLLALGDPSEENGEIGTETLTEKSREARNILYKHRTENLKETNDDADYKKRSKRNKRDRVMKNGSSRSSKEPTDGSPENEEFKRNASRRTSKERKSPQQGRKHLNNLGQGSKSPKPKSSRKESRKIKYHRSNETESAEERDRDTRSNYSKGSKGSKGSRLSRSSGHRKSNRSRSTGLATDDAKGVKDKYKNTTGEHDSRNTIPIQRATPSRKAMRRRSWSFDDFSNTSWSSSDCEDDIEVGLNDECEVGLNDEGEIGLNDMEPRRRSDKASMERSASTGGLVGKSSRRNHKRSSGANAIDGDMILGDPSRRAPPSRSKSNASRLQIGGGGDRKSPPTRSQSNDFSEYLRKQGLMQKNKSDRQNIAENKGEDEKNNPFEVTFQSHDVSDNWDPFTSEKSVDEDTKDSNERRGKLRPTKSGGLLQTSSKDTISRLPVGANVLATSVSSINSNSSNSEPCDASKGEREKQRDKQRRAVYKKSIAAAAMAGRRLTGPAPRMNQRQARTVQSSFEESVKQLEYALQRAR